MHQFDLAGRRAVVTGGAQGIGRAIAERLLRSRARVSLWDCDPAALAAGAGELAALSDVHTAAAAKTRIFEQMTQQHIDYMLSKIPRTRFVRVEEIASLAAWLVSEENSFATGAVYDMSGGRATY